MLKRLVTDYIQEELKSGKSLHQIKSRLITVGYSKDDVNDVMKGFETHKTHMNIVNSKIKRHAALVALIMIIIIVANALFFAYYSNNQEVIVVEKTPTGYVVVDLNNEEINNVKENIKTEKENIIISSS